MPINLTPGNIVQLGWLRPGDVGRFLLENGSDSEPFVVKQVGDQSVAYDYANSRKAGRRQKLVRFIAHDGRVEPARIVIGSEIDRITELETHVAILREACEDALKTDERDMLYILDNGRLRDVLLAALLVTTPKEKA